MWVLGLIAAGALFTAVLLPRIVEWRPTLGSRVSIWQLVVGKLYGAFPSPPESGWIHSEEAAKALGFSPAHSHNAVLDLFLIYGILPTTVFIVAIAGAIVIVRTAGPRNWSRPYWGSPVVRGVLIYMLVHSTVESVFLAGPVGALMCGVACGLVIGSRSESFAPAAKAGTKSLEGL
jgi:hypothetical protein